MRMSTSSCVVRDSINEPRWSKRHRVETTFCTDFLTNFLIEGFDVNFLSDKLLSTFFIKEDLKTCGEAQSIDVSF